MMDEKNLMEQIRRSAEKVDVPETLRPENMQKKLEDGGKKGPDRRKLLTFSQKCQIALAEAAVIALVFFAGRNVGVTEGRLTDSGQPGMTASSLQESETGAEAARSTESDAGAAAENAAAQDAGAVAENADAQDAGADAVQKKSAENESAAVQKDSAGDIALQEGIAPVESEEVLYKRLREYQSTGNASYAKMDIAYATQEMAVEDSVAMNSIASAADTGAGADFSQTNLRELGVDEGDIVKTDGKYIYIMKRNSSVKIISANGEQMELIQTIEPESLDESVRDMYISGNILNLVTSGTKSSMKEDASDVYYTEYYDYAKVVTYDISNPENPILTGSVEQEGYYHSSRKVGDYVYLFTQFQPVIGDTQEDSGIMPLVDGARMEAADIYVPEELRSTSYLVIGSVNVNQPSEMTAHKAVVSGAEQFYVSGQSIYICCQEWREGTGDVTKIMKFSYENGNIRGIGVAELQGYLNDTFSLDEYDNYLRVVATDWNSGDEINALYIYNAQMELVGKIADIAPGETIRSARFFGDTGYFVTFKQTDPLFSVDLSDPENPQIIGALKVTGFSSYLHFYGEDRLLGIGYEADEDTGATTGIKLSMFDISDPSNVTEISRYVIKGASYCAGLDNYKAILVNPEKNLLGFVCDDNYLVFSYDEEKGFENLLTYNLSQGERQQSYWYAYDDVRGLYINDSFYLAASDIIRAFDITESFEQKAKLEF
nr:beta-propeller domain-containing protein [uncultured Marvinbryantia sp.]